MKPVQASARDAIVNGVLQTLLNLVDDRWSLSRQVFEQAPVAVVDDRRPSQPPFHP